MPMSPRLLRPRASGATHPEALDWATRVTANGGTVSSTTLAAVSTFCASIQAAGIRDRFYRLNLFCGNDLAAALVPLYRAESSTAAVRGNTTDTNNGPFVAADFNNTGSASGLKGNGTSKTLNTGVPANSIAAAEAMLGVGVLAGESRSGIFSAAIGTYTPGPNIAYTIELRRPDSNRNCLLGSYSPSTAYGEQVVSTTPVGNLVMTFPTYYKNAVATGTAGTSATTYPSAHAMAVFGASVAGGSAGSWADARLGWYCIGLTMTQAQVTAFNNALNAFNSTLSRT